MKSGLKVSIFGQCRSVRWLIFLQIVTVTCLRYVFLAPVLSFYRSDGRGARVNTESWTEDPSGEPGMANTVTRG